MASSGRISGPLLKSNLLRNGVDLAFETDLLYLDVTSSRIGVNKIAPSSDLDVNGTIRSNLLIVNDELTVGNLVLYDNTILSNSETIRFEAAAGEATVYHANLQIDDLQLSGNTLSTTTTNTSIEIQPNGLGTVNIVANTNITGDLSVTGDINVSGNIVIGGNITLGDENSDTITFNARVRSDLLPQTDNLYDLGSSDYRWANLYVTNFITNTVTLPELTVGNITFSDNEISTTSGLDLHITGNGAGGVRLGNFQIVDNVITNITTDAVSQIVQSDIGYFKIAGSNGFVPPIGTNAQRPTTILYGTIPTGMTRYNVEIQALEIWNGSNWASPAGPSGAISEVQANNIAIQLALTLG
jgi:hypothetical protein